MPTPRFLVTGCAGFIGAHVLERLFADGYDTVGVDDFSTGSRDNLEPFRSRMHFIEGSLCDPEVARLAVDGVDLIIHLASVPSVPRSVANPLESANASVIGTVTLLNAAVGAGVRRVVQASSSSVYGESTVMPRVETLTPNPVSPYATAKLTQEHYARVFHRCYGLDTVSLRYFNVFGPKQNPRSKYAAVIPKLINGMSAGERPEIFGDGEQTRDFTYVGNVVDANLKAALHPHPLSGESVNIGNGGSTSLNGLVRKLNRLLGTDLEPVYLPPRTGDVMHSQAGIEKARQLFGFEPAIDFGEGLARTVECFQDFTGDALAKDKSGRAS